MSTCQLFDLTVSRIVVRRPGSKKARVIRGSALSAFLSSHASTLLDWDSLYGCYVARPGSGFATLMVFVG